MWQAADDNDDDVDNYESLARWLASLTLSLPTIAM